MASFVNGCVFTATSSGTGSFVVSAAVTGWQTPAQAGASNGATYRYRAYSADNTQWEIGSGVYTTGTVTLTRALIEASSNGGSATNFTLPPAVALTMFDEDLAQPASSVPLGNLATGAVGTSLAYARADHVHPGREVLTANRTYYVRTDGSDSNTGLADTSGGAFLTGQKAWDTVAALDLSIYSVTIKYASGTYTGGINMTAMPVGGSGITIEGDTSTPANVHLNRTATCFTVGAPAPAPIFIRGFKLTFAGANAGAVLLSAPSVMTVTNMELAGGSTGYAAAYTANIAGAKLIVSTGQLISGGMSALVSAQDGGIVRFYGITVTLTGTPAFSWTTIAAGFGGLVSVSGVTFSGAATGVRYSAGSAGGISTNGGGASFIPGNSSGSATSPGWYN
jgi:hypothetical protein